MASDLDYRSGWAYVSFIASKLHNYVQPLIAMGDIVDVNVQQIKNRVGFFK